MEIPHSHFSFVLVVGCSSNDFNHQLFGSKQFSFTSLPSPLLMVGRSSRNLNHQLFGSRWFHFALLLSSIADHSSSYLNNLFSSRWFSCPALLPERSNPIEAYKFCQWQGQLPSPSFLPLAKTSAWFSIRLSDGNSIEWGRTMKEGITCSTNLPTNNLILYMLSKLSSWTLLSADFVNVLAWTSLYLIWFIAGLNILLVLILFSSSL